MEHTRANGAAESHRSGRAGWLRAAVLGADDGIVSTASLVIGVAAATASRNAVLVAGVAGLVGGATSMAAGEYVSVSSQRDAEQADIVGSSDSRPRTPTSSRPSWPRSMCGGGWTGRWPQPWRSG
jgi:VIT1/CCC1 family predicted Fe2+/Mn2+ transporter